MKTFQIFFSHFIKWNTYKHLLVSRELFWHIFVSWGKLLRVPTHALNIRRFPSEWRNTVWLVISLSCTESCKSIFILDIFSSTSVYCVPDYVGMLSQGKGFKTIFFWDFFPTRKISFQPDINAYFWGNVHRNIILRYYVNIIFLMLYKFP